MSNTLTSLYPDIYGAMDIVSRELIGFIPRVMSDASSDRAAKGQTIRWPVSPVGVSGTVTPAATPPSLNDDTWTNRTLTLDTLKSHRWHWTGEERKGLRSGGIYENMNQYQFAQAFRVLANEIEAAIAALYYGASRATGTSGTTPFGSDLSDLAQLQKILDDNGAPEGDRHCIFNTLAGVNLASLTQLTNVNQAGTNALLRFGDLGPVLGFDLAKSAQIQTHTKGTSTGQDCTAVEPVGETDIAYDGGDGGTILAGDVITLASDTSYDGTNSSQYVVNTAVTAASGTIEINEPGLLDASAIGEEIAITDSYTANLAFSRDALVLGARAPEGNDAASDEMVVTDPNSGLSFRVAMYDGYHANQMEVSVLYGVAINKPEHMAILKG